MMKMMKRIKTKINKRIKTRIRKRSVKKMTNNRVLMLIVTALVLEL